MRFKATKYAFMNGKSLNEEELHHHVHPHSRRYYHHHRRRRLRYNHHHNHDHRHSSCGVVLREQCFYLSATGKLEQRQQHHHVDCNAKGRYNAM